MWILRIYMICSAIILILIPRWVQGITVSGTSQSVPVSFSVPNSAGINHGFSGAPQQRSDVTPRFTFRSRRTRNRSHECSSANLEGRCQTMTYCVLNNGRAAHTCLGDNRRCCVFYSRCGDKTSQEVFYFESPGHSLITRSYRYCDLQVTKKDSAFCGLRLEPLYSNRHESINCMNMYMTVNIQGYGIMPVCSNKTYDLDIRAVNSISIDVHFQELRITDWRVKITQINCEVFQQPQTQQQQKFSTIQKQPSNPVTHAPVPVVPSSNFAACGVAEQSSMRNVGSIASLSQRNGEPILANESRLKPDFSESEFYKHSQERRTQTMFNYARIVNGVITGRSEFPWQVAIVINKRFLCGASIIGEYWLLTAAHCVKSLSSEDIILKLGDWDLKSSTDGPHVDAAAEQIRTHPDFSERTLQNDIAVIKLKNRIQYTQNIKPVCLPDRDFSVDHKLVTVSGWGRNEHGEFDSKLRKLTSKVVSNRVCNQRWTKRTRYSLYIYHKMMCLSSAFGDTCDGDSGGPVVYKDKGVYYQVGIVSFGTNGSCLDPYLPGVYTRISSYVDWIRRAMN